MSKRTRYEKWERKRAHRIQDTIVSNSRRSSKNYKEIYNGYDRAAERQMLHKLKKDKYADVDYQQTSPTYAWDYEGGRGWTFYGQRPDRFSSNWWRGPRHIKLTTEDIHNLPRWLQFQIQKNIGESNRVYYARWYGRYTETRPISRDLLEELIADYIREHGLHRFNRDIRFTNTPWNATINHNQYYVLSKGDYKPVGPAQFPWLRDIKHIPIWLDRLIEGNKCGQRQVLYYTRYYITSGTHYHKILAHPNYHPEWMKSLMTLIEKWKFDEGYTLILEN